MIAGSSGRELFGCGITVWSHFLHWGVIVLGVFRVRKDLFGILAIPEHISLEQEVCLSGLCIF